MKRLNMYLHTVIRQGKESSTNYRIAEYLLNNYTDIEELSTSLLAEKCFVSKASISRFCRTIGVADFAELKFLANMDDNNEYEKFYFPRLTNSEGDDYLTHVQEKIKYMKETINYDKVDVLAKSIAKHKRVILMGISQSINYAYLLQQDLLYFHKFVACVDQISEQKEILLTADEDTLILGISVSGTLFSRVVEQEKMMQRKTAPTIYLISCQPIRKPDYVEAVITISDGIDYPAQIMLPIFVQLLVTRYKTLTVS